MMKRFFTGVYLIFIIVILIGCNNEKEVVVTNLTFRITWDAASGRGDAIRNIVSDFNNSQDEVFVTMVGGDEDGDAIEILLNSDISPDIYVLPYRYIQSFGSEGLIMPLGEYFNNEEEYYSDEIYNLSQIDGLPFGVPWIGHSMCLVYNKDILNEAGVNPAIITSYTDLTDALEQVEQNTDASGIGLVGANHHDLSWMTTSFIHSFGGSLIDDDGTTPINSIETINALNYYINDLGSYAQDGWEYHNGVDVMSLFSDEEIAFEIQGPWGITDIWKAGNPFEVGAISFSQLGGYSEIGILMMAVKESIPEEKTEAVMSFIEYMTSITALENIMDGEFSVKHQEYFPFRVPIRNDMVDTDFFNTYPEFLEFINGFEHPSINTPVSEWNTIHSEYYIPGLHSVILGEQTVEAFLINLEEEGNSILNDN